jgi:hypothetical protein
MGARIPADNYLSQFIQLRSQTPTVFTVFGRADRTPVGVPRGSPGGFDAQNWLPSQQFSCPRQELLPAGAAKASFRPLPDGSDERFICLNRK